MSGELDISEVAAMHQLRRVLSVAVVCSSVATVTLLAGPRPGASAAGDPCGGQFHRGAYTDFDNDGVADLAVAAPGATVGGEAAAGAVIIAFGEPGRAPFDGPKVVVRLADPHADDHFGASLLVDDFDGDCRADLVIGVPGLDAPRA